MWFCASEPVRLNAYWCLGLVYSFWLFYKELGTALRPVHCHFLQWGKNSVYSATSSCSGLFWYVCARCLHCWLKHMNHQDTLSPYFHSQDWTHGKIPVFFGDFSTNQCSAKPQPQFNIQTSTSASPLGFYSCSTWALDHSCSLSAVTLRHICLGQNANHLFVL